MTDYLGEAGPTYLRSDALFSAQRWLTCQRLPDEEETADEMIAAYYPGGLHWFIAEHLLSPEGDDHAPTSQTRKGNRQ